MVIVVDLVGDFWQDDTSLPSLPWQIFWLALTVVVTPFFLQIWRRGIRSGRKQLSGQICFSWSFICLGCENIWFPVSGGLVDAISIPVSLYSIWIWQENTQSFSKSVVYWIILELKNPQIDQVMYTMFFGNLTRT